MPTRPDTELLELIVKAGRRCVHDLTHAVGSIPDPVLRTAMRNRAEMWHPIFYPDNGPKGYRSQLHRDISRVEGQVARLERLCEEHGINHTDPDGLPF